MPRLKIKPSHYAHLKAKMQSLTKGEIEEAYRHYRHGPLGEESANRSLRHSLLIRRVNPNWIVDNLYPYLTNKNLDAALRKISSEIRLPYIVRKEELDYG